MAVKFFLGRDAQGRPHAYTFSHEENGARRIGQYVYDRLERQKETYLLVANPCYTGSYLELNPDLVILSEMGLGVIELKHHFGEIDCGDPLGEWRAGGTAIDAGRSYANPHLQVQSYADQIRSELIAPENHWLPGDPFQWAKIKIHTTVCFTNPFVRLEKCREQIQFHYAPGRSNRPWEKFSITTATEVPGWAMDLRFEVLSEADWFSGYRLLPGEIERLAVDFFHARPWDEIEADVRRPRVPFGYLSVVDEIRGLALPPFRVDLEEMFIGRNPSTCQIVIPQSCSLVSNRHARLIHANRRFYFEDLGSTNGSFFAGSDERLSGIVELNPNSRIRLGGSQPGEKVCELELQIERLFPERPTESIR